GDPAVVVAGDPGGTRPRCTRVQRSQGRAFRPVRQPGGRAAPDPAGDLLRATDDQALVGVAVGHHTPEDLQHGVGVVRVPAAGAETHLAEYLAVPEGQRGERLGAGHEVVERAVVPAGDQVIPQRLQLPDVAGPDCVLDGG